MSDVLLFICYTLMTAAGIYIAGYIAFFLFQLILAAYEYMKDKMFY